MITFSAKRCISGHEVPATSQFSPTVERSAGFQRTRLHRLHDSGLRSEHSLRASQMLTSAIDFATSSVLHIVNGFLIVGEFAVDWVRARDIGRVASVVSAHVQHNLAQVASKEMSFCMPAEASAKAHAIAVRQNAVVRSASVTCRHASEVRSITSCCDCKDRQTDRSAESRRCRPCRRCTHTPASSHSHQHPA